MSLSKQTKILHEVEREVPYCNFAALMRMKGADVPASVGGSCLLQSTILARRLRDEISGSCSALLGQHNGGYAHHIATVCRADYDTWIHDPSYLLRAPVALSEFAIQKNVIRYAFPVSAPERKAILSGYGPDLAMELQSPEGRSMVYHCFDIANPLIIPGEEFPINEKMAIQPRENLELQILQDSETKIDIKMSPNTGDMSIQQVGFRTATQKERPLEFNVLFSVVARHLGLTRGRLLEFFHTGREVYAKLNPDAGSPVESFKVS